MEFKKVREAVWESPAQGKMRVPMRVYAEDAMLNQMRRDRTFEQARNVATLPGILKASFVMPDGHEGYGFPIGGVAAFDLQDGVISPGGVGYDINCTDGEALVSLEHGTYLKMKELESVFARHEVKFADLKNFDVGDARALYFMKRLENNFIYEITTKSGRKIRVTGDHPIYTKMGMKKAGELTQSDFVAVYGFTGVRFKEPSAETIIDEEAVKRVLVSKRAGAKGNAAAQTLNYLKKLDILPLKYSSSTLPYFVKIMGYVFGDGAISFIKRRKGTTWFYGNEKDLEMIRSDIKKIGFTPSKIYKRVRHHRILTHYREYEFVRVEYSFKVASTSFASILVALGVPESYKASQEYLIPPWLFRAPLWIKRLFLASFFGAEMSSPATLNKYNFYLPTIAMNKLEALESNAIEFLSQLKQLLEEFGVETTPVSKVKKYGVKGRSGVTCGYRLQLLGNAENLINFFERVSFEYNSEKFKNACLAANYIRLKEAIKTEREEIRKAAIALYAAGNSAKEVCSRLSSGYAQEHFIKHSLWANRGAPRIAFNFMSFAEYKDEHALGDSGLAWDQIEDIEKIPYHDFVYDITVSNQNHDFVANGFVVSNCGVRLLATNFNVEDVKPSLRELINRLFDNVPCGVGEKGRLRLSSAELDEACVAGAKWAVERGYGVKEDLAHHEEEGGAVAGADPSKVSSKAKSRGQPQFGTLGSGNHFLEIQRVAKIFDAEAAKKMGVTHENQVTVMIHCLPGNAKVLTEYGCYLEINKLQEEPETKVLGMNLDDHAIYDTDVKKFYRIRPCGRMYKLTTESGKILTATEEHPLVTSKGLKEIKAILPGERVAVLSYEGVPYEKLAKEIIINEEDIRRIKDSDKIIKVLKDKKLLPLKTTSPAFPIMVKLLGFSFGDVWLGKVKDRWLATFIGRPEDLNTIAQDVERLGFRMCGPYALHCKSKITTADGNEQTIEGTTRQSVLRSNALVVLLAALGAPVGNKARAVVEVPEWLFRMPLWIKRLFLASYFGAELMKPTQPKKERHRFRNPLVSVNKIDEVKESGRTFLQQIAELLTDFGVSIAKIYEAPGVITKEGKKTTKLVLKLSARNDNLLRLWSAVGYNYNRERTRLAAHAVQYLATKNAKLIEEASSNNKPVEKLFYTNFKFRRPFPNFEEFVTAHGLNPTTPVIWDKVASVEKVQCAEEYVYDITVSNDNHNFIADGFVVGNCGSRGYGHQVCDDYIRVMLEASRKYGIELADKELCCAPLTSPEAAAYVGAMNSAMNYAFCNRQVIMHWVRETFEQVLKKDWETFGLQLIYDVCHNIAKFEEHEVDGATKKVCVHRKGATRSMWKGRREIPSTYRDLGQPVLIPGTMNTASYLLLGIESSKETWASVCFPSHVKMITNKGILPIKDVYERAVAGELFKVPSLNEKTLEIEWKSVRNVFKLKGNIIRVSISQTGRTKQNFLDLTPDHKMLTFEEGDLSEKSIAEILRDREMICSPTKLRHSNNESCPRFAYLLGVLLSDGSIRIQNSFRGKYNHRHGEIQFIQKNVGIKTQFIENVRNLFAEEFNEELRFQRTHATDFSIRGKTWHGEANYYICTKMKPTLQVLDYQKELESHVLDWDKDSLLSFLAGLIDGDGSYNEKRGIIHIYADKEKVVNAVLLSCLKLGILPQISLNRGSCCNIMLRDRLNEILERTSRFKAKTTILKKKQYGNKLFSIRQLFGEKALRAWPFRDKFKNNKMLDSAYIARCLQTSRAFSTEEKERIRTMVDSPIRMLRTKFVENVGECDVYNLEIDDNHNYVVLSTNLWPVLVKNCHGAGRVMSRHEALRQFRGSELWKSMEQQGMAVKAPTPASLAEEAGGAYKDVDAVVRSVEKAGISKIVAKMVPLGVIKG